MNDQASQLDSILSQLKAKGASPEEMSTVARDFLRPTTPAAPDQPAEAPRKSLEIGGVPIPDGNPSEVWQGFKSVAIDPILHPIDNLLMPAAKFVKSAIRAPVDAVRAVAGMEPLVTPQEASGEDPISTYTQDAAKRAQEVFAGTKTPGMATFENVADPIGGAGVILGAEGAGKAIKEVAPVVRKAVTNTIDKTVARIAGKTAEEILATPEAAVPKLSADEQKLWYRNQSQEATKKALEATQKADEAATAAVTKAKEDINAFQDNLGTVSREKAISLKQPAQQLMKDTSAKYVELTGEAAESSPSLSKTVSHEELSAAIDSKFEYDPEIKASLKADLGLEAPKAPVPEAPVIDPKTKLPVIQAEAPAAPATPEVKALTNQEILDKARDIMRKVSKTSKSGAKVYTPQEYQAMQKYSFLMEQLGKNGVDMTEANALWKQWAPVRDRIVREIRPFDEGNIAKMPITSTLQKAEGTVKTAQQAAAKLDARNFVAELEKRLKLPKDSIGADIREAVSKVENAKLNKTAVEKAAKDITAKIKADKVAALKKMTLNQYNTQRAARAKKIIKRVLIGLGVLGAAKATGLDKTVINAAAMVI